jgi:hypothetical protein
MEDVKANLYGAQATTPAAAATTFIPVKCSPDGLLYVQVAAGPGPDPLETMNLRDDEQDPAVGLATGACLYIRDLNSTWSGAQGKDNSDGLGYQNALIAGAMNYGFNGISWDRIRSSNVFRSAEVTNAGDTAVWTPAVDSRFRLLAWRLSVAGTIATAGTLAIQLLDSATVIARAGANVGDTYPANDTQIGADYGAQGILSAAPDNVLNINLSVAMVTGAVYIDVWGVEE